MYSQKAAFRLLFIYAYRVNLGEFTEWLLHIYFIFETVLWERLHVPPYLINGETEAQGHVLISKWVSKRNPSFSATNEVTVYECGWYRSDQIFFWV